MNGIRTIAIRGSGAIGMRQARVFQSIGARVVVVPDRPERRSELEAGGFAVSPTLSAIAGLDGVVVCTRTGAHVVDALEMPVPALVEKPLAVDGGSGGRLITMASQTGQSIHVAYCLRFNPGVRFVADRIKVIGDIDAVDAECFSWLPAWRPGRDHRTMYSASPGEGGVLLDLSHEVDLVNHLVGPGRCIGATVDGSRVLQLGAAVDESATIVTDHSGVRGTIRLSFARRPESRRLRVFGRLGSLEWDAVGRVARQLDGSGAVVDQVSWQDPASMYTAQAVAWLGFLSGGPAGALATGDDGLRALQLIDAARSLSTGSHQQESPRCVS